MSRRILSETESDTEGSRDLPDRGAHSFGSTKKFSGKLYNFTYNDKNCYCSVFRNLLMATNM